MVDTCTWEPPCASWLITLFLYRAFGNTAVLASLWDCRCSFSALCSLCALVSSSFSCWHSLATVVDWDLIASTLLCNDASMFVRASGAVLQPSPASSVTFNSLVRSATNKPCIVCVCIFVWIHLLIQNFSISRPWHVQIRTLISWRNHIFWKERSAFVNNLGGGGGGAGGAAAAVKQDLDLENLNFVVKLLFLNC